MKFNDSRDMEPHISHGNLQHTIRSVLLDAKLCCGHDNAFVHAQYYIYPKLKDITPKVIPFGVN